MFSVIFNFADVYSLYWNFPCQVFALGWVILEHLYKRDQRKIFIYLFVYSFLPPFHWEAFTQNLMYGGPGCKTHHSEGGLRTE